MCVWGGGGEGVQWSPPKQWGVDFPPTHTRWAFAGWKRKVVFQGKKWVEKGLRHLSVSPLSCRSGIQLLPEVRSPLPPHGWGRSWWSGQLPGEPPFSPTPLSPPPHLQELPVPEPSLPPLTGKWCQLCRQQIKDGKPESSTVTLGFFPTSVAPEKL